MKEELSFNHLPPLFAMQIAILGCKFLHKTAAIHRAVVINAVMQMQNLHGRYLAW